LTVIAAVTTRTRTSAAIQVRTANYSRRAPRSAGSLNLNRELHWRPCSGHGYRHAFERIPRWGSAGFRRGPRRRGRYPTFVVRKTLKGLFDLGGPSTVGDHGVGCGGRAFRPGPVSEDGVAAGVGGQPWGPVEPVHIMSHAGIHVLMKCDALLTPSRLENEIAGSDG
jgi:hypothetical protein